MAEIYDPGGIRAMLEGVVICNNTFTRVHPMTAVSHHRQLCSLWLVVLGFNAILTLYFSCQFWALTL